ncbi:hypothetical protein C8A01DRAFT_34277 [Parachaetomium inaequale]|uniref:Carrier domain-containing protein n=1 Tax=Parachaetomium inaequale TaxID=2588326 RepID=A0AAN6SSN3_9PEZI|nr:hypothetical protein C8A01DRAFT_34277 [Parachaetomium inaequale]
MVLRNSIFENMTHAVLHTAFRPTVQASWNLHAQLPADLSFFILLSSLGGARGLAAAQLVEMGLICKLSKVLFIAEQDIDPALPVYSAGVDSLVAVELKYWFLKELHAEVLFNKVGVKRSF